MKILTAAEMRSTDARTAEAFGISLTKLMTHAGEAVGRFILAEFSTAKNIVLLCGKGNNGGDGLMAAAYLRDAGCNPHVLLLARQEDMQGDPLEMLRKYQPLGALTEILSDADLASHAVGRLFAEADLIVDALVGTGFKPPLRGLAERLREMVHPMPTPVVSVDLPSGWDADSGEYRMEGSFRSDAVVTFTAPKIAHASGNLTGSATKPVVIASIGSPDDAIVSSGDLLWTGAAKRITEKPREADDNKGRHGHVILFAGSHGKAGAPSMASLAALRGGAGLVSTAVPETILATVASYTPELMTIPLAEGKDGDIAPLDSGHLAALLEKKTVIAVGPGLGETPGAVELVHSLLERATVPLVLDADALNIVAKDLARLTNRPNRGKSPVILTPHPGEMARLAGISTKEVQADRMGLARRFAAEHDVILVLKGWRTLVAHPDGTVAVNTTGNPGMAKGGSGDMLTGIVAALVAQHPDQPERAVEAAVYLHGLAADFAVREQDEHTLLVTDVLSHLWRAFRFRFNDPHGYVWWEGLPR